MIKALSSLLVLGLALATVPMVKANGGETAAAFYDRYQDNVDEIPLPACGGTNGLTATEMREIVLEHNRARMEADAYRPSGTPPLPAVSWDCDVAAVAQEWATESEGTQGHSRGSWRQRRYSRLTGLRGTAAKLGENLAWRGSTADDVGSAVAGVIGWNNEKADYNHETLACSGPACGHYTQVIWRESDKVGCGVKRDQVVLRNRRYPYGYFLVCNYHTVGNITLRGNPSSANPLAVHSYLNF